MLCCSIFHWPKMISIYGGWSRFSRSCILWHCFTDKFLMIGYPGLSLLLRILSWQSGTCCGIKATLLLSGNHSELQPNATSCAIIPSLLWHSGSDCSFRNRAINWNSRAQANGKPGFPSKHHVMYCHVMPSKEKADADCGLGSESRLTLLNICLVI